MNVGPEKDYLMQFPSKTRLLKTLQRMDSVRTEKLHLLLFSRSKKKVKKKNTGFHMNYLFPFHFTGDFL